MTFLFAEQYKCKTKGTPMVMMAFTNSKTLAGVVEKGAPVKSPKKVSKKLTPSLFREVKTLIRKGLSDESIMSKLEIHKMELAGYKAARTRELRGGWRKIKKIHKRNSFKKVTKKG
jgi:hypothetical protein